MSRNYARHETAGGEQPSSVFVAHICKRLRKVSVIRVKPSERGKKGIPAEGWRPVWLSYRQAGDDKSHYVQHWKYPLSTLSFQTQELRQYLRCRYRIYCI